MSLIGFLAILHRLVFVGVVASIHSHSSCKTREITSALSRIPAIKHYMASAVTLADDAQLEDMARSSDRKLNRTIASSKWLRLVEYAVHREECGGCKEHNYCWESVERTTRAESAGVDACDVVAIVAQDEPEGTGEPGIVLVFQYRAPAGCITVEFPAGLIDEGESIERASLRELREETGYVGTGTCALFGNVLNRRRSQQGTNRSLVSETSCEVFLDPALSNENAKIVTVAVDPAESVLEQKLEDEECIACRKVPIKSLYETLVAYQSRGFAIDARLFSWAHGFREAMRMMSRAK